jgi:hypothetical protein
MVVIGQLHAHAALPPGEGPGVHIGQGPNVIMGVVETRKNFALSEIERAL